MWHRKIKLIVICLCITSLLSGCWDSLDIQKRDIAMAIFTEIEGNQYRQYIESVRTLGGGDSGGEDMQQSASRSILFGEGRTLDDARESLDNQSDNEVFLEEIRALVLGKNLSEKGIETYLNRAKGIKGFRKNAHVMTTQTDMDKLIKLHPDNNIYIGMSLEDKVENLYRAGKFFKVDLLDLLHIVGVKDAGFVVPIVNAQNDSLSMDGYSIFKNFKNIGIIPPADINGLIYLLSDKASFVYPVSKNDNEYYFTASLKNRKIKPYYKDGKAAFDISFKLSAILNYSTKDVTFDENELREMVDDISRAVEHDINQTIYMSQKQLKCDYLGFFNYFHADFTDAFQNNNWQDLYTNANIHVKVDTKYLGAGMQELER